MPHACTWKIGEGDNGIGTFKGNHLEVVIPHSYSYDDPIAVLLNDFACNIGRARIGSEAVATFKAPIWPARGLEGFVRLKF